MQYYMQFSMFLLQVKNVTDYKEELTIFIRFTLNPSGGSSEADVHDLESSIRKVIRWFEGTSGHGSIIDDDIGENE